MYSTVNTSLLSGIHTVPIKVEVDISNGLPVFDMVGNLSAEVREAKERVKTALHNCEILLPAKRITVNLSPGNIKKTGTGFDLAIAVALLSALGLIDSNAYSKMLFVGELSLNGTILPVKGILPIVSDGKKSGIESFVVPAGNLCEANLVGGIKNYGFSTLMDLIAFLNQTGEYIKPKMPVSPVRQEEAKKDFSQVNGQLLLRRACEIAAAGMHNMLMIGPPGAGKTMISERMAGILPPLNEEERLELSKIYSVCGLLNNHNALLRERPFRSPHHTITRAGLTGGGVIPMPGEISLAHCGVLFLDELPEFHKDTLEILRQPMEDKQIHIVRSNSAVTYPAGFLLLAAMNPCNCGYYPDMQKCRCSEASLQRYFDRISQPLIDRIDLCVEAESLTYDELTRTRQNECTEAIRNRVVACQRIQNERYMGEAFCHNSQIPAGKISVYCKMDHKEEKFMEQVYIKHNLTGRSYHKIIRVARTIADLDGSENIQMKHLKEAVCYRSLDTRFLRGAVE